MIENLVPEPGQKANAFAADLRPEKPATAEPASDQAPDVFDQHTFDEGIYGHVSGTVLTTLPEAEVVKRLAALVAEGQDPDSWPKQVPPALRQKVIDSLVDRIARGEVPDATLEAPWRVVGQQLVAGLVTRIADNKIADTWPQHVPQSMVDQVLAGLVERIEAGNVGKGWPNSVPQWFIDKAASRLIDQIKSENISETWVQAFHAKDDPPRSEEDAKAAKLVKDVYCRLWTAAEQSHEVATLQRLYRALEQLVAEPGRGGLLLPPKPAAQKCSSRASKGENGNGAGPASGDPHHLENAEVEDLHLRFYKHALFEAGLDTWQKSVLIDCLDVDPGIFADEIDQQICQIATPGTTDKDYASIYQLAGMPSLDALRRLVGLWAKWIAINRRDLMQVAGEAMRKNSYAVLPLVEQLDKGYEPATKQEEDAIYELNHLVFKDYDEHRSKPHEQVSEMLRARLVKEADFQQALAKLEDAAGEKIVRDLQDQRKIEAWSDRQYHARLRDAISRKEAEFKQVVAKLEEVADEKMVRELREKCKSENWSENRYYELLRDESSRLIDAARLKALREASVRVTQFVARQLAEMSDERFYGNKENRVFQAVGDELRRHAQPILAYRLSSDLNETDIRRRESYTRLLANLGGREAGDALVRAVLGEERTRASRQDLLATYYLVPSLRRGEEAAALLKQAADEAKRSLRLLQGLNVAVFVVGLAVLIAGLWIALTSPNGGQQVAGGLAAIGGLAGVITQLVRDPLDRIQDAMTNLVQLETAFTSFIWELNLNGTYVQSKYVNDGKLDSDTIEETVGRIEQAMGTAMSQAALYTESAGRRLPPVITQVLPVAVGPEREFTVYGQRLLPGDGGGGKGPAGLIAINHVPVRAEVVKWDERSVVFKLSDALPGADLRTGTAWLSLLVAGTESNALPFHLLPAAEQQRPREIEKPADSDQSWVTENLPPVAPAGAG